MDATLLRLCACCVALGTAAPLLAATYTTTNFVVTAPSQDVAQKVGDCAEFWRRDLALQWFGQALPNWYKPCPISVRVGQIGAGGQTTFTFENGEVFGWKMQVQGSLERILDSVVPHEVNHTIFASYFRRPLPRWADEGAATLFEHEGERARQTALVDQVLKTSRRIPLKDLLQIREYPQDMQDVLTLYAEGYSLAEFLIGSQGARGKAVYLKFLHDAHHSGWEQAIRQHYSCEGVADLEQRWTNWILAGSPSFDLPADQQLAQASQVVADSGSAPRFDADVVVRSQSPDGLPLLQPIQRALRESRDDSPPATAAVTQGERPRNPTFAEAAGPRDREQLTPTASSLDVDIKSNAYAFPGQRSLR